MEVVKKVKLNLTVAQEVKDYLIHESDLMGMSCSAYITMLINQSKQQAQVLPSAELVNAVIAKIKDMEVIKEFKNKCACYICKIEVPGEVENHFTAEDGRILCTQCSLGVAPCSDGMKEILIENQRGKK